MAYLSGDDYARQQDRALWVRDCLTAEDEAKHWRRKFLTQRRHARKMRKKLAEFHSKICPGCDGTGEYRWTVGHDKRPCSWCEGRGVIFNRREEP